MNHNIFELLRHETKDIHQKVEQLTPFHKSRFEEAETIQYCMLYERFYQKIQSAIFKNKELENHVEDLPTRKRIFYFTHSEVFKPNLVETENAVKELNQIEVFF